MERSEEEIRNIGSGQLKSLLSDCTVYAENASSEADFRNQMDLLFTKYSLDISSEEALLMKSVMVAMKFHPKLSSVECHGGSASNSSPMSRSQHHDSGPVRVATKSSSITSREYQHHLVASSSASQSTDSYGYGALSDSSQIRIRHHVAGYSLRPSQLDDDEYSTKYPSGSDIPSSEDSHSRHSEVSVKDLSDGEGIGIDLNTTAITTRMKSRMSLTSPPVTLQPTDAGDRMHLQDSRSSSVSPVTGTGQSSSSQGSANSGSSSDRGNDDLDSSEPDERIMFKSASDYITFSTPEQNPPSPLLQSSEVGDVHDEDPCYNLKKLSEGLEEESEEAYLQSFKKSSPPHVAPSPPSQDRFSVLLTHPQGTALDNLMQQKALAPSSSSFEDNVSSNSEQIRERQVYHKAYDVESYFNDDGLSDFRDMNVTVSPLNPNAKSREIVSSLTEQLEYVIRRTISNFPMCREDVVFSKELINKVGHDVVVSQELKDLNADDAWNAMRPVLNMFVDASVKDEDNIRLLVDTICLSLQHPKSRSLYVDNVSSCPDSDPMDSSSGNSSDSHGNGYMLDTNKSIQQPLVERAIICGDDVDMCVDEDSVDRPVNCASPAFCISQNIDRLDGAIESQDENSFSSSDSSVTVVMMVDPSSFQGEIDNQPLAVSEQQHDGNRALYTGEYRYDDCALAIEGYDSQDSDATPDRGVGVGMLSYQDSDDHHVQDFETNSTECYGYVAPWEEETGEDILYSPARNTAKSSKSPTSVSPLDHQFRTTVGGIGRPSLKSLMIYSPNRKKSGEDGGEGEWYRWDQEGSGEAQGDEEDASWGTGMWVDGPQQREVSSATQDWTSDQVEVALDCVIGLDDLPDVPDAASSIIQSCKSPQLSPPKLTLPSSLQGSPERSVLLEHIDPNGISRRPAQFMLDRNGWRDRNEKDEVAGDIPDDGCIENVEELRHLSPRSTAYQVAHSYSSVQEPINGLFGGQLDEGSPSNSVCSTSTASTVENSHPVVGSTGHHRRCKSEKSSSNQMFQSFCDEDVDLDDEEYDDNVLFMGADESRAAYVAKGHSFNDAAPTVTWDDILKSSGSKKKMNHSMCSTASSVSSYEDALAYALHKDKKDLMPSSSVDSDRNLSDTASTAVNVSVDEKGRVFVKKGRDLNEKPPESIPLRQKGEASVSAASQDNLDLGAAQRSETLLRGINLKAGAADYSDRYGKSHDESLSLNDVVSSPSTSIAMSNRSPKSRSSRSNSSQSSSSSGSWNSGPSHGVSISSVSMNTNTTGNLTRTTVGTGLYSNTESGSVPYGVSNQQPVDTFHSGVNGAYQFSYAVNSNEFAESAVLNDSDTSDESSRSPSLQSNETSEGGDASDASQSPHMLSAHPSQLSIGTDLAVFNGVSNVTQYAAQREAARQPVLDANGADDDEDDEVNTNVAVVTKLHGSRGDAGSVPNQEEDTIETSATTLGDYEYDGYLYPHRVGGAVGESSDGRQMPWDFEIAVDGHRGERILSADPYSTVSSITSVGGPRHTVSWDEDEQLLHVNDQLVHQINAQQQKRSNIAEQVGHVEGARRKGRRTQSPANAANDGSLADPVMRMDRNTVSMSAARPNTSYISSPHSAPNTGEPGDLSDKYTHLSNGHQTGTTDYYNRNEFYHNMLFVMNAVGTNADVYNRIFGAGEHVLVPPPDQYARTSAGGNPVNGTCPLLNERILRELLPHPSFVEGEPTVFSGENSDHNITGNRKHLGSQGDGLAGKCRVGSVRVVDGSVRHPQSKAAATTSVSHKSPVVGHIIGKSKANSSVSRKGFAQPTAGGVSGQVLRKPAVRRRKSKPSRSNLLSYVQQQHPLPIQHGDSLAPQSAHDTYNDNAAVEGHGSVGGAHTEQKYPVHDEVDFPMLHDGDAYSGEHGEVSGGAVADIASTDEIANTSVQPMPMNMRARTRPKSAGKMSYLASHPSRDIVEVREKYRDMQEGSSLDRRKHAGQREMLGDDTMCRDLDSHAEPDYVYPMYDERGEPFEPNAVYDDGDVVYERDAPVVRTTISSPRRSLHHTASSLNNNDNGDTLQSTALLSSIMAARRSASPCASPKRVPQPQPQLASSLNANRSCDKRKKSVDMYSKLQGASAVAVAPHSKLSRSSYESYVCAKGRGQRSQQCGSSISSVTSSSHAQVTSNGRNRNGRSISGVSRSNRRLNVDPNAKRDTRLVSDKAASGSASEASLSTGWTSARTVAPATTSSIRRSTSASQSKRSTRATSKAQFAAPTMSSLRKSASGVKGNAASCPLSNIRTPVGYI